MIGRLLALTSVLGSQAALAHDVKGSVIYLDFGHERVIAEVQMPVRELRSALQLPIVGSEANAPLPDGDALAAYVHDHLSATTPGGKPFEVQVLPARIDRFPSGDEVVAEVVLTPPTGESARSLVLQCDLIDHRVISHNVYLMLRKDLPAGLVGDAPTVIGMFHFQNKQITVERPAASWSVARAEGELQSTSWLPGLAALLAVIAGVLVWRSRRRGNDSELSAA